MKKCTVCNELIPAGRVKALPATTTCVEHSNASPYVGNIVAIGDPEDDHYQEIDIIRDPKVAEEFLNYQKRSKSF